MVSQKGGITIMKHTKLIAAIILMLVAVIALVFVIKSVHDGLPEEGTWKGNIHQWKPSYNGEGLVIILVGIVGAVSFLSGAFLLPIALRQDV
jgi:hypothetical protein